MTLIDDSPAAVSDDTANAAATSGRAYVAYGDALRGELAKVAA